MLPAHSMYTLSQYNNQNTYHNNNYGQKNTDVHATIISSTNCYLCSGTSE